MLEDELLSEGQIKRKKRLILLGLLALFLITAAAAALLGPTTPTAPTVADVNLKSPAPDHPATSLAEVSSGTFTPELPQEDEFSSSTVSPASGARATPQAATLTALATKIEGESGTNSETPPGNATVEATRRVTFTPETTSEILTPAAEQGLETSPSATPGSTAESEPGLTATLTPPAGTPVAEVLPTTEAENQATPAAVATSRRIHESWDILDGGSAGSSSETDASEPVSSTTTLTSTPTLSETMALVPPDGLPVTGIVTRRGMNWAALVMVVVLLGAGTIALLHPQSSRR